MIKYKKMSSSTVVANTVVVVNLASVVNPTSITIAHEGGPADSYLVMFILHA